jgi:hypothetical protein
MRPNSKLIKATLTGALGGLLFGFDSPGPRPFNELAVRLVPRPREFVLPRSQNRDLGHPFCSDRHFQIMQLRC